MRRTSDEDFVIRFRRDYGFAPIIVAATTIALATSGDPERMPTVFALGGAVLACLLALRFARSGGLCLTSNELLILPKGLETQARRFPYEYINRAEMVFFPRYTDREGDPIDPSKGLSLSHENWMLRIEGEGGSHVEVSHRQLPAGLVLTDLRRMITERVEIATGRRLD